ncbi:MAG: carboxy terminal-processing peptidase, partial [Verrucomicrobia bacterium]|nr:carboxy terminal-processing peptidase [Verrucomicrobiota bacterium]
PQGPVVIIKDERGASILPDMDPEMTYGGPLVILINRHTASAGEILAGALQDYGRALVVGDSRTHGKGTVQTVKQLGANGELGSIKVTNAQFYRITGSSTQLKGVTSDIWVPSPFDYTRTGEERLPYALQWSMTQRARFGLFADMTGALQEINRLSTQRLAKSERFSNYTNMLVQFEAINLEEELPLNLEVRRERALMRNKLKKVQEEFPEVEDDVENDPVLSEALHIVSDLITLTPNPAWPERAHKATAAPPALAGKAPEIEIDLNTLDDQMRKRIAAWIEALGQADEKKVTDTLGELNTLQSIINLLRAAHLQEDADPRTLDALRELVHPAD